MNKGPQTAWKALVSRAFRVRVIASGLLILWCSTLWATDIDSPPHIQTLRSGRITPSRHEVLIYYVSETAPTMREAKNYSLILNWLDKSGSERAETIAKQLRKDLHDFPDSVDFEIRQITEGWKITDMHSVDIAIFTNRLAHAHKFLTSDSATGQLVERSFEPTRSSDYILSSNVLAQAGSLRAALKAVAQVWSPTESSFVLVTNSHGNGRMTMTPRLIVHGDRTTRQELLDVISGKHPPSWNRIGITRTGYVQEIAEAGSIEHMSFSLVLPHSCNDDPVNTPLWQLPPNVGTWLNVTGSAPYRMVDYAALFSRFRAGSTLSAALVEQLKKYDTPAQHEVHSQNDVLSSLRFAPLLLTLSLGMLLLAKGYL
jgi:hypothetical protein